MAIRAIGVVLIGLVLFTVPVACTTAVKGNSVRSSAESASSPAEASDGSSSAGASATAAAAHPCALLTHAEAETLAGTTLDAALESGGPDDATLCQFVGTDPTKLAQVEVLLGDGAKKVLDVDRDILGHEFTTVKGVGDEAYQEDDNIFVRKGNTWAGINLALLNDPSENVQRMQVAAKQIAGRLK